MTNSIKKVLAAPFYRLLLILTGLLLTSGKVPVQEAIPFSIKGGVLPFTPQEFYIAQVSDQRADRKAVAYLLLPPPAGKAAPAPVAQPVDLQGGGLAAIREFVREGLPANKRLRPVVVRLKEVRVTETPFPGGRADGKVIVALAFDIQRNGKTVHTLEYRGGARYNRLLTQTSLVAPTLRQALSDGLAYLNTWMNREADRHEKLATGIRVHFTDHVVNNDPDTLFYHPGKPLAWSDFKGQPRGTFSAAVFTNFSYEGASKVVNGIIHVNLLMKVFVVRNASWAKAERDAYGLNHEQKHFDIVKLVVERFKKEIQSAPLSLEDYNSNIQYQFLESWREMTALQEQYDNETRHGLDQAAQARWDERIAQELKAYYPKK